MMPQKQSERFTGMREMFAKISSHYDLMNTLMTFGRDRSWRRHCVKMAGLPPGGSLLDVGAGTGGIAREALKDNPALSVTAVDFNSQMMSLGRKRQGSEGIQWCRADALHLPFPDASFDAVASGYLVRNVSDIRVALEEQVRVVKPEGRVVCLDTSPPPHTMAWPLVQIHLKIGIPLLGWLITRDRAAYRYLVDSTRWFLKPHQVAAIMKSVGLKNITCRSFMFGTQVIYRGVRPRN